MDAGVHSENRGVADHVVPAIRIVTAGADGWLAAFTNVTETLDIFATHLSNDGLVETHSVIAVFPCSAICMAFTFQPDVTKRLASQSSSSG